MFVRNILFSKATITFLEPSKLELRAIGVVLCFPTKFKVTVVEAIKTEKLLVRALTCLIIALYLHISLIWQFCMRSHSNELFVLNSYKISKTDVNSVDQNVENIFGKNTVCTSGKLEFNIFSSSSKNWRIPSRFQ